EKIDLETLNNGKPLTHGMYDADKIKCSEEYLKKYHKKGIDANNENMIYQVSEANRSTLITKGYYNNISHINLNYQKLIKMMEENKMTTINEELSKTTRNTTNYKEYNKYVLTVRKHKKKIWEFYGKKEVRG